MQLDRQPTLTGPALTVRPLRAEDLEALYAVAADPLLWEQHPSRDRYRREVFEPFFDEALSCGGGLTVIDRATGAVIGSSRFDHLDLAASRVEIGWTFLARSAWGGAVNRELKRLMIDHAFAAVDTVVFRIGPENLRSRRAVEKLGAREIGTSPHPPGPDWIVYELTPADWTG